MIEAIPCFLRKFCALFFLVFLSFQSHDLKSPPSTSVEDFQQAASFFEDIFKEGRSRELWPASYLAYFEKVETYCSENCSREQKLLSQFYLLSYYDNQLDSEKVVEIGEKLLGETGFIELEASVYTSIALSKAYERLGMFRKQLEMMPLVIELDQKFDNLMRPSGYTYYHDLAMIYYQLQDYEEARRYFTLQSEELLRKGNDFRVASMFNNIALTYERQRDTLKAMEFYRKSIEILEKDHRASESDPLPYKKHFYNVVQSNLASLNMKNMSSPEVKKIFLAEIKSSKEIKEPRITRQSYINLSQLYLFEGNVDSLQKYLSLAKKWEESYPDAEDRADILSLFGKMYYLTGDKENGYLAFAKAEKLKDSLQQVITSRLLVEATAEFDYDQISKTLSTKTKELEQNRKAVTLQWIVMAMLAVLLTIIGIQFFKANKDKKKISKQRQMLKKNLKEKELLLQETHHRVKNNLQMISGLLEMKQHKVMSADGMEVLQESQEYLTSMALIHQMLYDVEGSGKINAAPYLEKLIDHIARSNGREDVKFNFNIEPLEISTERLSPLGLLVNELVINSFKHARVPDLNIMISLERKGNSYHFRFKDSGTAVASRVAHESHEGMGITLIKLFVEEMESVPQFEDIAGFGIKFTFND